MIFPIKCESDKIQNFLIKKGGIVKESYLGVWAYTHTPS